MNPDKTYLYEETYLIGLKEYYRIRQLIGKFPPVEKHITIEKNLRPPRSAAPEERRNGDRGETGMQERIRRPAAVVSLRGAAGGSMPIG